MAPERFNYSAADNPRIEEGIQAVKRDPSLVISNKQARAANGALDNASVKDID